ncbi:hypothetical protein PAXINDRAFT_14335 [Paxillus involutus ATCC 200175]|uniref:Unplaced genomic scaffold PAXINscaffold_37, whole genome shotgun sequence n=1 Tax=Paxillus involutus ATCC 200175 TaxID=664439 RepID=A0A0C9TZ08_PAXIN|nr:hypothetical protein PAXINDRAFT_14335 [Paxillus involutus ATCC 200175]
MPNSMYRPQTAQDGPKRTIPRPTSMRNGPHQPQRTHPLASRPSSRACQTAARQPTRSSRPTSVPNGEPNEDVDAHRAHAMPQEPQTTCQMASNKAADTSNPNRARQTSRGTRLTKDERGKGKGENDKRDGDFDGGDEDVCHMDIVPSPTTTPEPAAREGEERDGPPAFPAFHERGAHSPQAYEHANDPPAPPRRHTAHPLPPGPRACQTTTKRPTRFPHAHERAKRATSTPDGLKPTDLSRPGPRARRTAYLRPTRPTGMPDASKTAPTSSKPTCRPNGTYDTPAPNSPSLKTKMAHKHAR